MKLLIYTSLICFFSSLAFASAPSISEAGAFQLRVETKLDIPKGATGLIFANGKVTPDFSYSPVCNQMDSLCVLDTLEVANSRDRFFEVNTILNLKRVPSMCGEGRGFIVTVTTLRNEFVLRCKIAQAAVTTDELQKVLAGFMTIQFPAKID